jgi:hypothetical protein
MKRILPVLLFAALNFNAFSQNKKPVSVFPPGLASIKETDLHKDIFELGGDSFRGRRSGTIDELRAAAWVAQKAQEAGLKPAGDDGTYFQFLNLRRNRLGDNGTFSINGKNLLLWKDVYEPTPSETHLDGPITWLRSLADTVSDLKGKIVAIKMEAPKPLPFAASKLWNFRYISLAVRQMGTAMRNHGAAAIIIVADSIAMDALDRAAGHNYKDGQYLLEGVSRPANTLRLMPVIVVNTVYAADLQAPNATVRANMPVITYLYPTVNVIAKASGTDPVLKNEFVLFSGHHDHDGVWRPIKGDSTYNGADDNASVTVAMLAIGRAWVSHPGKRSALFVWHGAEERGLLGSRYYAVHPTVKKEAIVAVLNADMIGRNSIDSAALLGSILPHRNSTALVNMAMQANKMLTHFVVDTTWDNAKHPEGWYFRSDHLPYAQAGIPALMYSSLLHDDYHTVLDNPDRIDIGKLFKMTEWMYATGWLVSQSAQRVGVDIAGNKQ